MQFAIIKNLTMLNLLYVIIKVAFLHNLHFCSLIINNFNFIFIYLGNDTIKIIPDFKGGKYLYRPTS